MVVYLLPLKYMNLAIFRMGYKEDTKNQCFENILKSRFFKYVFFLLQNEVTLVLEYGNFMVGLRR